MTKHMFMDVIVDSLDGIFENYEAHGEPYSEEGHQCFFVRPILGDIDQTLDSGLIGGTSGLRRFDVGLPLLDDKGGWAEFKTSGEAIAFAKASGVERVSISLESIAYLRPDPEIEVKPFGDIIESVQRSGARQD